jgi:hypothetical protein
MRICPAPWRILLLCISLCALYGCGGSTSIGSVDAGLAPSPSTDAGTAASPSPVPAAGLQVDLQYRNALANSLPDEVAQVVVHVLDRAGNDLIDPVTATRDRATTSQIVPLPGVPDGTWQVLVVMLDNAGKLLGDAAPPPVSVSSASPTTVTVSDYAAVASLAVAPDPATVRPGATAAFTATLALADSSQLAVGGLAQWTTADPTVAAVTSNGTNRGVASGIAAGTTTITATFQATGSATLTVSPTAPALLAIAVNGTTTVPQNGTSQLTAIGTYDDSTTRDITSAVTWTSSSPDAATVSATGLVSGVQIGGPVTITATDPTTTIAGSTQVTVAVALLSIDVLIPAPSLQPGQSTQLTACGTFSDGSSSDVTSSVAWSSSDPTSLTVSATGLVTGVNAGGPVTITAAWSAVKGTTQATITAPGTTAADTPELIAAINAANAANTPTTITLVAGQVYDLTTVDNFWFGPTALPPISAGPSNPITIEGNGAVLQRDPTAPSMRIFYVSGGFDGLPAGALLVRNLTIKNGRAVGGSGGAGEPPGGGGAGMGGAIFNQGTLTLDRVTLLDNVAQGGAGGDRRAASGAGGGGGMGGNGGAANLNNTGGGGGGMSSAGGDASNTGGHGGGFVSAAQGGGGSPSGVGQAAGGVAAPGPLGGNGASGSMSSSGGGGGFEPGQDASGSAASGFGRTGGRLAGGSLGGDGGDGGQSAGVKTAGGGAFGGGGGGGARFEAGGGGGVGGGGGGAGLDGTSEGAGGFGGGGGGKETGQGGTAGGFGGGGGAPLETSTFAGGSGGGGGRPAGGGGGAGLGGAIFNHLGILTLVNCTLTGNTAQGGDGGDGSATFNCDGGSGGSGMGGAILNLNGNVTMASSTLSANQVADGAAGTPNGAVPPFTSDGTDLYNLAFGRDIATGTQNCLAVATLSNSILAGGVGGNDVACNRMDDGTTPGGTNTSTVVVTSNLVTSSGALNGAALTGTPVSTADPQLGPLANNGGPTLTMLPGPTSPAINAGTNALIPPGVLADQRGFVPRVNKPDIDLGAVEVGAASSYICSASLTDALHRLLLLAWRDRPRHSKVPARARLISQISR